LGILLGASYMLWTLQRIYLGKFNEKWSFMQDLDAREYTMLIPLSVVVIFLGVYPSAMINLMNKSVVTLIDFMSKNYIHLNALVK
jgi:NADH-quinone oxidoreductase subunit M